MLTTGAYSKKYQQIERDRAQHLRDQEKRTNRERALLLSKQTAQRQKALEEKKRAMAVAEEQRRRKALEERRKAQLEATARFRSAMCRAKSNPKAKHKPMDNVEIYLPDKAKADPKSSSGALKVQQRVAYGREVEVKDNDANSGHTGLQRCTPSLDDVLNQIRGGDQSSSAANGHPSAVNSKHKAHQHGHINVHHHSSVAIPSSTSTQHVPSGNGAGYTVNYAETRSGPLLRGRSASDSNLSSLAVHHTSTVKAQQSTDNYHKDVPDGVVENDRLKLIEDESEVASSASDELVFKPVADIGSRYSRPYYNSSTTPSSYVAARMVQSDDGTRVVSPEPAESSSSSDRSFSPPPSSLNDSLDQPPATTNVSSVAKQVKASRQQHDNRAERRRVKLTSSHKKPDSREKLKSDQSSLKVLGVPAAGAVCPLTPATPTTTFPTSQPIYICQESESSSSDDDNDSLNEEGSYSRNERVVHRSKKHVQQPIKTPVEAANAESKEGSKAETQGQSLSSAPTEVPVANSKPKIVGILKKMSSSSIESSHSMSNTHMDRTNSGSQISTVSSAKSQKRVRFIDQVATNNRHNAMHALHSDSMWNHVLPNGFNTHHLPNSAFTPRMRVLLSSKAPTIPPAVVGPPKRPTGPSTLNGITVHVPVASVESPPSPNHPPLEQKSPQDSDSSEEDTAIDRKDVKDMQAPQELNKNGDPLKTIQVGGEPTSSNRRNTAKLIEDDLVSKGSNSNDVSNAKAPSVSEKSLDKTPTDNEINEMWEQIKTCLEENKQSTTSVPVQVYPFQMPTVNGMQRHGPPNMREIVTDTSALSLQREQTQVATSTVNSHSSTVSHSHQQAGKAHEQIIGPPVRLVHRQSNRNRPMRCHHQQSHNQAQLPRRHQSHTHHDYGGGHTHHSHTVTYPFANQDQSPQGQGQLMRVYPPMQTSSREPELVVRATASPINGRTVPTALSLEEQRLLQSIEKLNQRLKDHLVKPQEPVFQPPASPEPHSYPVDYFPHHHHHHQATPSRPHAPHNGRSRGHTTDLPKNRVHRHHKNAAAATTTNSRPQHRTKVHRQDFYNT